MRIRLRTALTAVPPCVAALAAGCVMGFVQQALFHYSAEARRGGGESAPLAVRPPRERGGDHVVRDGTLTLTFRIVTDRKLRLEVGNHSGQAAEVLVDRGRFVGTDGSEDGILASARRTQLVPVGPVPAGGRAVLFAAPQGSVSRHSDGRWYARPLTGSDAIGSTREEARRKGRERVGRAVTFVIPVRIGTEIREYRLRFEVSGFHVERTLYA